MSLLGSIKNFFTNAVETFTKFITMISSDHNYIHAGIAHTAIIDLGSISVATNIGFTTPSVASGKYIHWRPLGIETSADFIKAILYEADSYSGGTTVTPINRNRNSSSTSQMQTFATGVTSTPTGTKIQITGIGTAGTAANKSGGGSGADEELVLKQNTDYVIQITPAGATTVTGSLFWYEEDQG